MRWLAVVFWIGGCAARAPGATLPPPDAEQPMPYRLGIDPWLRPETGTQDLQDGFRFAFWVKDHWLGRLELDAQVSHPILLGVARAAELFLVDVPVASYATVLPHEVFGHGGRLREFGGRATYTFELPPPYSFTPSETHIAQPMTINTPDTQLLFDQAGIIVERYEVHAALRASFAAGTLNHIDSGLLFGVPIHEFFEATLPWSTNDARAWTTLQAARFGASSRTLQRRYLVSTAVINLIDPTFIYSCYDLLWRFLVRGERTGAMPSIRVGQAAVWAGTHLDPTPWGLEYNLHLLGRWRSGPTVEIAPRWGGGPGGWSAGISLDMIGIRVLPDLVVDGRMDLWAQPSLDIDMKPVLLNESGDRTYGARLHTDIRWEQPGWFLGLRVGAKTKGMSGLEPIAASAETVAYVGLLLGRP